MASEAPAKTKEIPAQADVRIVGGKTNVKLRAYGVATCARMSALLTELMTNAVTHPGVSATSQTAAKAVTELLRALNSERE